MFALSRVLDIGRGLFTICVFFVDFSSDFKPITLGNGLVNSAKFYTGPQLSVDNHNTFSPSDS